MAPSATTTSSNPSLPVRKIYTNTDLERFQKSPCHREILQFVQAIGQSCGAVSSGADDDGPGSDPNDTNLLRDTSPGIACLLGCLKGMEEVWLTELPPVSASNSQIRFGNPVFTDWHTRLTQRSLGMIQTILKITNDHKHSGSKLGETEKGSQQAQLLNKGGEDAAEEKSYDMSVLQASYQKGKQSALVATGASVAANNSNADGNCENSNSGVSNPENIIAISEELSAYLLQSFGHPVRLDYGTGHECSFLVFLMGLYKHGVFSGSSKSRFRACGLSTFHSYLQITRALQIQYRLEPAGSHGVWGLDDYHCLPFYFGANQLIPTSFQPSDIHHHTEDDANRFLYFGCVRFIREELKRGAPFHETSPMLHDISSSVPTWQKVASGLLKLFEGEVLGKRPVVQHFVFGKTILVANWESEQGGRMREPPTETLFRTATATTTRVSGSGPPRPNHNTPGATTMQPPPVTRAPWATKK